MEDSTRRLGKTLPDDVAAEVMRELFGEPANDHKSPRVLKTPVLITGRYDDPVDEYRMNLLREEARKKGLEMLQLMNAKQITIKDAKVACWTWSALQDSAYDLNPEQFDELIQISARTAGVLKSQLKAKQVA